MAKLNKLQKLYNNILQDERQQSEELKANDVDHYDVYSEFDIEKHAKTFVNYLEVIITPDGKVHYAVPSHQQYLINMLCKKYYCTNEQLQKLIPQEYYFDVLTWLLNETKCVSVWNTFYRGKPNQAQQKTIDLLIEKQLLQL